MRQVFDPTAELLDQLRPDNHGKGIDNLQLLVDHNGADLQDLVDEAFSVFIIRIIPFQIHDHIKHNRTRSQKYVVLLYHAFFVFSITNS